MLLLWLVLALQSSTRNQAVPCDTSLVRRGTALGDYGYRSRTGRCEGIFGRSVSAPPDDIAIIGLEESFEAWDLRAPNDIQIVWDAPPTDSVSLSATARRPLLFYRMDTVRPSADTVFRWPFRVLTARRIPSRNVAVLAKSRLVVQGSPSQVYVPVRIGHLRPPVRTGAYRMVVLPNVPLRDLAVRVVALRQHGDSAITTASRPVFGGPFEAETGVDVPLPEIKAPGLYRVTVGGTRRNGGPANMQWLILVPSRSAVR